MFTSYEVAVPSTAAVELIQDFDQDELYNVQLWHAAGDYVAVGGGTEVDFTEGATRDFNVGYNRSQIVPVRPGLTFNGVRSQMYARAPEGTSGDAVVGVILWTS
jgi:hypothetical protein